MSSAIPGYGCSVRVSATAAIEEFVPPAARTRLVSQRTPVLAPCPALQVQWKASSIPFVRRFERYLDFNFFEHQVRGRRGHPHHGGSHFGTSAAAFALLAGARSVARLLRCWHACRHKMPALAGVVTPAGRAAVAGPPPPNQPTLPRPPPTHHPPPADPLVLHLQLLHDGYLPDGPGVHDPAAHAAPRLRALHPGARLPLRPRLVFLGAAEGLRGLWQKSMAEQRSALVGLPTQPSPPTCLPACLPACCVRE